MKKTGGGSKPLADFLTLAREHERWKHRRYREGRLEWLRVRREKRREKWMAAYAEFARVRHERNAAARRPRIAGLGGWKVLAARLRPHVWYGSPDMIALMPEYPRNSIKSHLYQELVPRALVERALNPGFDPRRPSGFQVEPRFLFRLTPDGDRVAEKWRRLIREREGG